MIDHSSIEGKPKRVFFLAPLLVTALLINSYAQNVSVDPSTGTANVSIPVYTLNYGSISVPINLTHTESALKVEEGEGDAGLGWNLTCNYGIYHQVRGLPDDLDPSMNYASGWLFGTGASTINNFAPQSPDNLSTYTTGESNDYTAINNLGYIVDTEPDLYTAVAPGLYFQFVYDASGVPRLLNYQDVKITVLVGGGGFTVQNNKGQTFQFTTQESVSRQALPFKGATIDFFNSEYNYFSRSRLFNSCWHLTSITDPMGKTVNFNYATLAQAFAHKYRTRVDETYFTNYNIPDTLYYTLDSYQPMALTSITAGNYSVGFVWSSARLLSSIAVSESGVNDSFSYGFVYQYAKSTNDANGIYVHKFLSQIIPLVNCTPQVPYKFTYQGVPGPMTSTSSVDFPWNNYFNEDMWGSYSGYSGARSTQGIPPIYFYSGLTDSRRFSFQQIPNSTGTLLPGYGYSVSAAKVGIGSLVQITYPTGGSTKIVWERNKYYDSLANVVVFGPGLRVSSLASDGGEAAFGRDANATNPYHQIVKTYTYTRADNDTISSGLALYPPEYALASGARIIKMPYDLSPGSYVAYRRVKESTTQGSTVYTYSNPAMYPTVSYSTDWTASKSKIARNPTSQQTLANVQNGYYTFPFAPNPNYGFAQGLLTSVSDYSTTNSLVRQKKYYYSRINPALHSVYGLKFEYLGTLDCDCFHFSKYQIITGSANVLTQEVSTEVSETNSTQVDKITTYYHYNSDVVNNNFLMDSVRTVFGDGSVNRKKIRYVKDFASLSNPTPGDLMANSIPLLVGANRHGEIVEQCTTFQPIGGAATITGASLQLYQPFTIGLVSKALPYQSFSFPEGYAFTPAAISTGATQGFSYNSSYLLSTSFNDFDVVGNPASVSDNKQNKIAYHNALNYALGPVASIVNATAVQTVYEGFEFTTGRNLTPTTGLTYVAGWTGQQAASLVSGNTLFNTNVSNAGIPYRVSCYVKAAQNASITFKFVSGGVTIGTVTLQYTALNQWTYQEGSINISSSTPSVFTLQVTSSSTGNITIDDILVLPQNATAATKTFLPLKGATSQSDDRGNSTTITYDPFGRKVNTFDRQRNLTELDQYLMKGTTSSYINSAFTYTTPVAGSSWTASLSSPNCFGTVSYQWKIDGAVVGNSSTLNTTVAVAGVHSVVLTVTNTVTLQTNSSTQKIVFLVNSTPSSFSFSGYPAGNTITNIAGIQTYTISSPANGCAGYNLIETDIDWYQSINGGAYVNVIGTGNVFNDFLSFNYTYPISYAAPGYFDLKVTVKQTCSSISTFDPDAVTTTSTMYLHMDVTKGNGN